jgi:hypothetical protein
LIAETELHLSAFTLFDDPFVRNKNECTQGNPYPVLIMFAYLLLSSNLSTFVLAIIESCYCTFTCPRLRGYAEHRPFGGAPGHGCGSTSCSSFWHLLRARNWTTLMSPWLRVTKVSRRPQTAGHSWQRGKQSKELPGLPCYAWTLLAQLHKSFKLTQNSGPLLATHDPGHPISESVMQGGLHIRT